MDNKELHYAIDRTISSTLRQTFYAYDPFKVVYDQFSTMGSLRAAVEEGVLKMANKRLEEDT